MFEGYSNIYFERRRKIHVIPRKECEDIFPFLKFLSARRTENELFISNKDLPLFSSGLYPILEEYFNVSNDGFYPSKYSPDIPKFKIYIDMPDLVTITCDIQAIYHEGKPSETTVRLFENSDGSSGNNGQENESEVIIKRNYYQESSIIKLVSQHFDELDDKKGLLILSGSSDNEDKLFAFIADDIPKLARLCDVYLSDAIKSVNISSAPTVNMGISVVSDLLELSIVPQEITAAELNNILGRYRLKKKYYRLSSGDIIDLQTREMDLLYSLNEGLGLSPKDILAGHISIPKYRALFLNELTDDNAIRVRY